MRPIFAILIGLTLLAADTRTAWSQTQPGIAAEPGYRFHENVSYKAGPDLTEYERTQCRLDVYYPEGTEGFSTLVWFHAGGLLNGERAVLDGFREQGFAVVSVSYRFSPKVTAPAYIEDAAAAVAWTMDNIADYGGDADRIFVTGHSAGGYLASMIGYDKSYLAAFGKDADDLAGLAPISGHTVTHFTVRSERGIDASRVIVDEFAPLYHARPDAPPTLLITGDAETELLGRHEENAFFWRMLQVVGHPDAAHKQCQGFDHGGIVRPAQELVVRFMRRVAERGE